MATELENRLRTILEEKLNKIIPENIKKGVTIFDIEGNCEPSSIIDNGIHIEKIINWTKGTYYYTVLPKLDTEFKLCVKIKDGATLPSDLFFGFTQNGDYDSSQEIRWIIDRGNFSSTNITYIGNGVWCITNKYSVGYLNYLAIYPPTYKENIDDYLEIEIIEVSNNEVEQLIISPLAEEQVFEGIYDRVVVSAIDYSESGTLSPEEYTEAQAQISDLFGEEASE